MNYGTSEEYQGDLKRCDKVGSMFAKRWTAHPEKHNHVLEGYSHIARIALSTASAYITNYLQGNFVQSTSKESRKKSTQTNLYRLSHFCYLLGIKPDNPEIGILRKINPDFEFPPTDTDKHGEAPSIDDLCSVEVSFPLHPEYNLSEQNMTALKQHAYTLARRNARKG